MEVILREHVDNLGAPRRRREGRRRATPATTCCRASSRWRSTRATSGRSSASRSSPRRATLEEKRRPRRSPQRLSEARDRDRAPRRREQHAVRVGHLGRHRAGARRPRASRSTSGRSRWPIRSRRSASAVPVKIHRDVTAQVKVRVVARKQIEVASAFRRKHVRGSIVSATLRAPAHDRGAPVFAFRHTPVHARTRRHPERTLPHNLEAEKSVLGAILIHNEAFNHAAELIDSRDFFRDAHRRIFDEMVALSERGDRDRFRHAEGGAGASGRARRGRRSGLHRVARRRRAAIRQRRVLRADRQREVDAPQPDPLGQQDPRRGLPRPRRSRISLLDEAETRDFRDRRGPDPRRDSCRCATWSRAASRRSRSCSSTRGSSPACRPASSISTR